LFRCFMDQFRVVLIPSSSRTCPACFVFQFEISPSR
jgi:hypothetical protein